MLISRESPLHWEFCEMLVGLAKKISPKRLRDCELGFKRHKEEGGGVRYYPKGRKESDFLAYLRAPFVIGGTHYGDTNEVKITGRVNRRYRDIVYRHLREFSQQHPSCKFEIII